MLKMKDTKKILTFDNTLHYISRKFDFNLDVSDGKT